ncbi:hypothetical protein, partial [Gordonia alkanivorans]|uniref:hypothetical protein n=1 Tax=Gordonia alkanivorans TaxID=84096 RepID=UPI001E417CAB
GKAASSIHHDEECDRETSKDKKSSDRDAGANMPRFPVRVHPDCASKKQKYVEDQSRRPKERVCE